MKRRVASSLTLEISHAQTAEIPRDLGEIRFLDEQWTKLRCQITLTRFRLPADFDVLFGDKVHTERSQAIHHLLRLLIPTTLQLRKTFEQLLPNKVISLLGEILRQRQEPRRRTFARDCECSSVRDQRDSIRGIEKSVSTGDLFAESLETGSGVIDAIDARGRVVEFVEPRVQGTNVDVFLPFENFDAMRCVGNLFRFETEGDPPEVLICFGCVAYSQIRG